jgi:putative transport protein
MFAFGQMAQTQPVAHALLVLATVAVAGLALGTVKYRGIGLGTAGVLFAGILFGHFGESIEHTILDFVREFGLVLFVFTIGLQLGPGFFAAFRQQGFRLNALAASVVLMGAGIVLVIAKILGIDFAAALGLFSGATTNTPSLGAAQQTLNSLPNIPPDKTALPALAYALAYPVGIAGIIGSILFLRLIFRIDVNAELERFRAKQREGIEPLERMNLVVENPNLDGLPLGQVPGRRETGVVVSRIRKAGATEVEPATEATVLHTGDILLAVGTKGGLTQFVRIVGGVSDADLMAAPGQVTSRRIVVTNKAVLGKTLKEIGLEAFYRVTVTRVTRADLEMTAVPDLRLQFGDLLQIVGGPEDIPRASAALGNSLKALNDTQFIPLFIGIALGLAAGLMPISFPGLPVPVRLGLAGGPLVLAILLSRLGHVGRLVWHMPLNANLAFRELGITLFLSCVGLKAGEKFFSTVFTETGLIWALCAVFITTIPLVLIGSFALKKLKLNFMTVSGLLAGSTTDPPALAFASALTKSDAPTVAYATVYPLTMLLRILVAQALVLFLFG